jgi:hypothetical protein
MPKTAFDPGLHGFAFKNEWSLDQAERRQLRRVFRSTLTWGPLLGAIMLGPAGALLLPLGVCALRRKLETELARGYGLCGGMSYAALDFFQAGLPIPRGEGVHAQPAPGTRLRSYIWQRQLQSLACDLPRFLVWLIVLNDVPSTWLFRGGSAWLLDRSKGEWKRLRAAVDAGQPVPIGLVRQTRNVFENHQVLAIGYDREDEVCGTIYVYDPNCPDDVSAIRVMLGERTLLGQESCSSARSLRGFFCESYRFSDPARALG